MKDKIKWYGEEINKNLYIVELDNFNAQFVEAYLKIMNFDFIMYDFNKNIRFVINCKEIEIMKLNDFIDDII